MTLCSLRDDRALPSMEFAARCEVIEASPGITLDELRRVTLSRDEALRRRWRDARIVNRRLPPFDGGPEGFGLLVDPAAESVMHGWRLWGGSPDIERRTVAARLTAMLLSGPLPAQPSLLAQTFADDIGAPPRLARITAALAVTDADTCDLEQRLTRLAAEWAASG